MAYFYRLVLKRIAYVLVGLFFSIIATQFNEARADYPAKKLYYVANNSTVNFATARASCDGWQRKLASTATGTTTFTYVTNTETSCNIKNSGLSDPAGTGYAISPRYECAGPVYSETSTICGGTAPLNPCEAKKGQKMQYSLSSDTAASYCLEGCNISNGDSVCIEPNTSAQMCYITGIYLGTSCTTPVVQPPTTVAFDCVKNGQTYGTVNGTTVCLPKGTSGSAVTPTKLTQATTNVTNTGTSDSTKSTTINGDTVTTTTTTINNLGQPSSSTKSQDKASFCEESPNSPLCKAKEPKESSFAGTCSSSFVCDGDAIQCSIAKKIHQNKCDELKDQQDSKTALLAKSTYVTGEKLINGQYDADVQGFIDGAQSGTGSNTSIINIPTALTETGSVGYAIDEIDDQTHTLMGRTFTVPFSKANFYFYLFGNILLALAYLGAYRIVTGAI